MIVYELVKSVPADNLTLLMSAGIFNKNTQRNIEIFEIYSDMRRCETPMMKIYADISELFCLSEDNVRKIIQDLKRPVK